MAKEFNTRKLAESLVSEFLTTDSKKESRKATDADYLVGLLQAEADASREEGEMEKARMLDYLAMKFDGQYGDISKDEVIRQAKMALKRSLPKEYLDTIDDIFAM